MGANVSKKETFEDLLKSIANAHQVREDYKIISKEFRLHLSTVKQIMYKLEQLKTTVILPTISRQTKITTRATCITPQKVTKNPRAISKNLKTSLALMTVSAHKTTIRRTLYNNSVQNCKEKATTVQKGTLLPIYNL